MEYIQKPLATDIGSYRPNESEREKASYSYLMSVVTLMVGMPLPIVNLIASLIFWLANKRASYFVRWHCMQALLSQLTVFLANSFGMAWTLKILFSDEVFTNNYIAYMITLFTLNLYEIISNIICAIKVRDGKNASWFFWGELTNLVVKK